MKRTRILSLSFLIAAFAVSLGFGVRGYYRAARYQQLLENSYTHAFYELSTAVSELDTALQKARYVTTPVMLEVLCTDIYGKALSAQMSLGELPASSVLLEQTSAFLARTGDYALSLAKSATAGTSHDGETTSTLRDLADVSSSLSSSLLTLQSGLEGGSVSIDMLVQAEQSLSQTMHDGNASPGGTSFQSIEADFPETPALIYDGPFSEHLSNRTPLALEGLHSVTQEEAQTIATHFLSPAPQDLTCVGSGEGVLPVWEFSGTADGAQVYMEVTKQGGNILSLLNSRPVREASVSIEDALDIAKDFLSSRGYHSMQESYHIDQGNVLTVNFAPVEQEVLCYPDLVKVSVARDNGAIVGFESHGWITNHTDRTFTSPAVDESTARSVVSPELEILSHRLALIPSAGEYEVLCHEFKCRSDRDTNVIVYVNAATGNEEKILLLMEDENGTLVW